MITYFSNKWWKIRAIQFMIRSWLPALSSFSYLQIWVKNFRKEQQWDKTENRLIFHPPFKRTIFFSPYIYYGTPKREKGVIHTFVHLIVVSLISFLHIVRRNSMRIHHSDNRRKEQTRRDEVRRREVRGTLRMSEVVTELGEGGS